MWERCCIGRGVAALRHKADAASFTYYTARALQVRLREYEHAGTVFGAINRKQFAGLLTQQPLVDIVHAFERLARPLDGALRHNTAQIDTLVALRDILLPRLITGALRVRNVKRSIRSSAGVR